MRCPIAAQADGPVFGGAARKGDRKGDRFIFRRFRYSQDGGFPLFCSAYNRTVEVHLPHLIIQRMGY
jgi:hypothetical protein